MYKQNVFELLGNKFTMMTDESNRHFVSVDDLADAIGFQKEWFTARAEKYGSKLLMEAKLTEPHTFISIDKVSALLFSIEARDLKSDYLRSKLIRFQAFGTCQISTWKPQEERVHTNQAIINHFREQEKYQCK